MKNIILSLLIAFSCAITTNTEASSKRSAIQLHVVAYNSPSQGTLGVNALERSAKVCKIKYDELSSGLSRNEVLRSIFNYIRLKKFRDTDVILIVDKNSTIFVSDKYSILQTFLKVNKPFIMSASKKQPIFLNKIQEYLPPPPVKTLFNCLNARAFMGRVGEVRKLFTRVLVTSQQKSNDSKIGLSEIFNYDFFYNQSSYALDYRSQLFLSLYDMTLNDLKLQKNSRYRVVIKQSYSQLSGPQIITCESGQRGGGDVLNTIYIANFG